MFDCSLVWVVFDVVRLFVCGFVWLDVSLVVCLFALAVIVLFYVFL